MLTVDSDKNPRKALQNSAAEEKGKRILRVRAI